MYELQTKSDKSGSDMMLFSHMNHTTFPVNTVNVCFKEGKKPQIKPALVILTAQLYLAAVVSKLLMSFFFLKNKSRTC